MSMSDAVSMGQDQVAMPKRPYSRATQHVQLAEQRKPWSATNTIQRQSHLQVTGSPPNDGLTLRRKQRPSVVEPRRQHSQGTSTAEAMTSKIDEAPAGIRIDCADPMINAIAARAGRQHVPFTSILAIPLLSNLTLPPAHLGFGFGC